MPVEKIQCMACRRLQMPDKFYTTSSKEYVMGVIPYCKDCMTKIYQKYVEELNISVFDAACMCCVKFDVAAFHSIIKTLKKDSTEWIRYMDEMVKRKRKIDPFGAKGSLKFWIGKAEAAAKHMDKNDVTEEQLDEWTENWGKGVAAPYTVDDYRKLDRIYTGMIESRPALDGEEEMTIRQACMLQMQINKLSLMYGDKEAIANAKNMMDILNKMLDSTQLRKKDKKEENTFRVDDMIKALERKGMVESGKILPLDKLMEKLSKYHHSFPHTKDLAEQMLEKIMNCTRANQGMSEYTELPEDMRLEDYHGECSPSPTPREEKVREELGIPYAPREGVLN